MNEYNCEPCDYSTLDISNFKRHQRTNKHTMKCALHVPKKSVKKIIKTQVLYVDNITQRNSAELSETHEKQQKTAFQCLYCKIFFKRNFNYNRHLKSCVERSKIEDVCKQIKENEKLRIQLAQARKEIKNHKSEKEYYRQLVNNYSTFGPKTFNSLTYIMNNYNKAPHIEKIVPKEIKCFADLDNHFIEKIVNDYKHNIFVDFIVDTIKHVYLKDNPEDQSIWSTDTSRYNYIIKELLENKNSYWVVDKKGVKSKDYLVDPILKFMKDALMEYTSNAYLSINDLTNQKKSITIETQKYACLMIQEIEEGSLGREIVKKLAKHLFHKNSDKLDLKDSDSPQIEELE